ncbi:MAG: GreA/GreB family elongation factor [Anaerolineae bacterium]
MTQRYTLTRAGYEQLQRQLAEYQERRASRQDQLDDVQADSDKNVPEEGADFDVRTMTEFLDERIGNLTEILEHADVIDQDPDDRTVDPGDRVTLWNLQDRAEVQYDLIGSAEAMYGREGVSLDSPVGAALKGKRVGDVIDVQTPDGAAHYTIRRIERSP